ncbi:ferredoxin [Streptomyces sp. HNM0575]|uniref:ferredoxin n=1 Tax=Streptomyces sp. HNM0575 TaxID=2716338 RepID=UPI00145CF470|nr:ferredoxin [Streptomyces sp. HNM0575]NLU76613.1 ferredoxin [Streptomyces sp. HNM0575]
MVHVSVVPDRCIGAAQCVLTAPDVFDQDEDGFVEVLDAQPEGVQGDKARMAAKICPSQSIVVRDDAEGPE